MRWRPLLLVLAVLPALMALRAFAGVGAPADAEPSVAAPASAVAPATLASPVAADPSTAFADSAAPVASPAPTPTAAPDPPPPPAPPAPAPVSETARIIEPVAPLFTGAQDTTPALALQATTEFGGPRTLLVVGATDDRVAVLLPLRPNGSVAWIARDDVEITQVVDELRVDLATRTLTWMRGADVVLQTSVAIGAPATPTPPGRYSVTDLLPGGGAYGPAILALSGYSEALDTFNGGDARLALHGTSNPGSIGQAASFGCVRVPNDLVTVLAESVPLGTPVQIG